MEFLDIAFLFTMSVATISIVVAAVTLLARR
jgi:hypothetical protein